MDDTTTAARTSPNKRPNIWREWELAALVALVTAFYLLPINALTIRGEEPRRAQVAREMLRTGDWVVPRVQEQLFLSRPPLHNWLIAAAGVATGSVNELALRLPTVLSLLATAILIYWYARQCSGRLAALAAAAGFVTMGQVLELGRLGETELFFTLLVSSSLLIWHARVERGQLNAATWILAYALVGLGILTKGVQPPVYFGGAAVVYLGLRGRWRDLISWGHLAGIATAILVWAAWQGPYYLLQGWEATRGMYWTDVAMRFEDQGWMTFVEHLAVYPVELLACMLPWSLLLIAYLHPRFRRSLAEAKPYALFAAVAILVAFPSCWLVPGAKGRYFMPLYPCFAILLGFVVERTVLAVEQASWRVHWNRFATFLAAVMLLTGPGLLLAGLLVDADDWSHPFWMTAALTALATPLAVVAYRSRLPVSLAAVRRGVLAIASFTGMAYCGIALQALVATNPPIVSQVEQLKDQLPSDVALVSYGVVDPNFLYVYNEQVEARTAELATVLADDAEYFCLSSAWGSPLPEQLTFAWRPIATINCDRSRFDTERTVIVGQRLPTVARQDSQDSGAPALPR